MQITAIKTHRIQVGESLESVCDKYVSDTCDGDILAITSKIVSICQGRVISKHVVNLKDLINQEADEILKTPSPYGFPITIKNGILIPSAGIDGSNSQNSYILYPQEIQKTLTKLWNFLRQKYQIKNLGIIVTDSHTTPLRLGVTGIALGWCGFLPTYSYIGKPDLDQQPLRVTHVNVLDALSTSAVLMMGEGNEQTPLAIIRHAPKITFLDRPLNPQEEKSILIEKEKDLYAPLFQGRNWHKKD